MKTRMTQILGEPIRVRMSQLDDGWDVGIFGGSRTHVGAVTMAEADGRIRTLEREGHRDAFVSEKWARELAMKLRAPVCVRCGIHYDGVSKAEIAAIVNACDGLLEQIIEEETVGETTRQNDGIGRSDRELSCAE